MQQTQKALVDVATATNEPAKVEKEHRKLIDELGKAEALYAKQLEHREKFRLRPKGGMKADGSRRCLVPDTSSVLLAKTHPFKGKTITIEADITAGKNPRGLRREKHLVYGTEPWRKVYGLRNSVESVNRNVKRVQHGDLQNADNRHVRGNTFTYVVATFAAVCENLRKILSFLKQHLATRTVTSKNADVAALYWAPDTATAEVEAPLRT